jgi:uncharacterized protein
MTTHRSIVEQIYEKYAKKDIDGIVTFLAPNVRWALNANESQCSIAGIYNGPAEVAACLQKDYNDVEYKSIIPKTYFEGPDHVIVIGDGHYRIKKMDNVFIGTWIHLFKFENGKIIQLEMYINVTAK